MSSIKEAKRDLGLSLKNGVGFRGIGIRDDQLIVYAQAGAPFLDTIGDSYEGVPVSVVDPGFIRTF